MATYNSSSMWDGVLGEELTGGTEYTFALQTYPYPSQSVYANAAYFMVDSSLTQNYNLGNYLVAGADESSFDGTFRDFTNDISQSNFISSSCGFAFNIQQISASTQPGGEFKFTPTTTIPANSYLIKASGHFLLTIA